MAPVITLLVSPDDAQKLTLASTEGHIQLALRNPLDTKQDDLASVKTGALYRTLVAPDNAPAAKPRLKRVTVAAPPPTPPLPCAFALFVRDIALRMRTTPVSKKVRRMTSP